MNHELRSKDYQEHKIKNKKYQVHLDRMSHFMLEFCTQPRTVHRKSQTRHADSGHSRELQATPVSKPHRLGLSEQMVRLPRSRPVVDTGKVATLPGKSERRSEWKSERFGYLDSGVQSAAAHVERLQDQLQGMSRVAGRTVQGARVLCVCSAG